jgi:hypothetical protein
MKICMGEGLKKMGRIIVQRGPEIKIKMDETLARRRRKYLGKLNFCS